MSAETLRAAAKEIRDALADEDHGPLAIAAYLEAVGFHDPTVALAVADWLDDMAAGWKWDDPDELHLDFDDMPIRLDETTDSHALAVARAVLGGDA